MSWDYLGSIHFYISKNSKVHFLGIRSFRLKSFTTFAPKRVVHLPLKHICHLRKNLQYKNQWKNIHPFPTPYYIFVRRGGGRIALAWIVLLPNCIFLFCQGSGKKFVVGWVLKPILMLSFGLSQAGQFMNL